MNPTDLIKDWFAALAPRERIMVMVCGVVIVLALVWQLLINPLFVGVTALDKRVADKTARLATMQEQASQIWVDTEATGAAGSPSRSDSAGQSIVVIIDRTTRSRQLAQYLKRNQPDGNNGVRLRLEGAPFDTLMSWLGELNNSYGMKVSSANFDESGPGRVNCSIVIVRAP